MSSSWIADLAKTVLLKPKQINGDITGLNGAPVPYIGNGQVKPARPGWLDNLPIDALNAPTDVPATTPPPKFNIAPDVADTSMAGRSTFAPPVDTSTRPRLFGDDIASLLTNPAPTGIPAPPNRNLPTVGGQAAAQSNLPTVGSSSVPLGTALDQSMRQRVVPYQDLSPDNQIDQDTKRKNELLTAGAQKEPSVWKRLAEGALEGLAHNNGQGGVGGLIGSAIGGAAIDAASPKIEAQQRTNRELGRVGTRLQNNYALRDKQLDQRIKTAQAVYAEGRPDLEQQKVDLKSKENDERSKANAMRVVASVYNKSPSFDSKDPANADVVQQMRDLGLPIIDKSPNKDIKYITDEGSGEMFLLSTDKQTGETSAEQIMSNGQPLKITTKSQIGMKIKDLDRASQEKIAEARNNTSMKIAGMNIGSREKVATMNQQGANDRVDKTIKAADDRQKTQLMTNAVSKWQQNFQKTNFRPPTPEEINKAQESIRKTVYGQ